MQKLLGREGGGGPKNEPYIEKYYVVPLAKEGKFSSESTPDLPKIMTSPRPPHYGRDPLSVSYFL